MRALVVDDDANLARMLRRGLTDDGYRVDVVSDGVDAIWQAIEFEYDVIVLDVMLPGADGFEVCRQLRAARVWTPVLMLTARTEIADRVAGLDVGADDYLAKPFGFVELAARLRALLRRGASPRPTVLAAGTLSLDPAARRAWRNGQQLDLSATEFVLLELFLRHVDRVLTRTVITEHIWDWAAESVSNVVDQYVSYLRRKIDKPFGVEQLVTVRGAGYRLLPEALPTGG
jgi:two-component system, OmpR family, response regulator